MHYGKKNIARLIFLFICLLIYFRNNFNADIIFNQDLVFNGNLSVKNNVNINGHLLLSNINANTTISGNFTVSSDSPTTVIFENSRKLYLESVEDFTGINPLYLIIDINTYQVYTTPTMMRNNFSIDELIVNNIISNPNQNLTIGQPGNTITIGNGENNIIFEKKLSALGGITSNNNSINLNGDVYFTENLNAVDITTTNADITIGQNRTDIENIINCQNFTINEPLTFYDTCIVGNSNLEDTININGYISTQNITFGSENNPVVTVTGLPVINNPQAYLISNTDNTISTIDTVTGNLPTISIDTLTTDILNVNKIIASTPNEDIFFITPTLNILTNKFQYSALALEINTIYSQSIIKNYMTFYLGYLKISPQFYSNTIHVFPNKKIETISFFQSPDSSGFKIDTLICNAENYFFKNLTTTTENTNNICLDKTNNNLVFTAIADYNKNINIDTNLLSPVSFNYNDNYTIKNNDICNKTKEKIIHFGFIAEDLRILNKPNILTYDSEGNIYDYNTDILWNIINKKIIDYQNYLTYANLVLEKITTYNQNLAQDIKKQEQQITAKKKTYQKIKNINAKG